MIGKLLTNKKEKYDDYNRGQFIDEIEKLFLIKDRQALKKIKGNYFL